MQMDFPACSIGSIQWLSELGMDDPILAKSIDGFWSGESGRFHNGVSTWNNHISNESIDMADGIRMAMGFQLLDAQKRPLNHLSHSATCPDTQSFERQTKIPRVMSAWDACCNQQQVNVNLSSLPQTSSVCNTNVAESPALTPFTPATPYALESLLASFSTVNDECVAPRTPTVQREIEFTQISEKLECQLRATHSAGTTTSKDAHSNICSANQRMSYPSAVHPPKSSSVPFKAGNSQDHIMAERKRREKLTQRFIALSAIVPGLKKMDKASVLGDAIKYVKQLQDRLRVLEEQTPKTMSVSLQKTQEGSSQTFNPENTSNPHVEPVTEVRMIGKNVLIRVHCEKKKGVLIKSLAELENLQLSVMNANILLFTEAALDLTFTAQVEEGCELTADDIAKALQDFFKRLK
ncbi:hypothetical protein KP509_15G016900 [Ceratopteris richardii]|uniref:BHLH domain-containing protein n=1 Tax=Ceratopteris richardii TaxID=49495 RepID=A0A8T2T3D7_CERRI|nr:hypothetical protein KP509_15G016900 [Ceratopteris richardii]